MALVSINITFRSQALASPSSIETCLSIINFVNCVCMSFANSSSGKGQFVCVDGGEEDSAEREESGATGTSYDLQK